MSRRIARFGLLLMLAALVAVAVAPGVALAIPGDEAVATGCTDGIDNDGDGNKDGLDPECQNGTVEVDPRKPAARAGLPALAAIRCGISGRTRVYDDPTGPLPRDWSKWYGRMTLKLRGLGDRGGVRRKQSGSPRRPQIPFTFRHLPQGGTG